MSDDPSYRAGSKRIYEGMRIAGVKSPSATPTGEPQIVSLKLKKNPAGSGNDLLSRMLTSC
jgi:hypothetical protein